MCDNCYTPPENPTPIVELTDEQVKELAQALATGQLFTNWHLPEHEQRLIGSVFMPIGFGVLATYDLTQIGMVCEHLSKAGPRAINGYPMFMSVRIVNVAQADAIRLKAQKITEAIAAV